ncbi:hypothetical protein P43SY_001927 [Pythium insidiosum]|uniref:Zinc finger C2HC5-type domain-containing protein n=1 Tax=Pythium insidiosum TaxID=114742 RepID=A0AAD5LPI7_PYTIN|nr:hypothetical protein P43SY_001927 [Pythium insidiosum]
MGLQQDAATRAWLRQELVSVLGFAEVDDILSYVLSSFQAEAEVESYLCELLGLPASRARAISTRLFAPKRQPQPQQKQKQTQQQKQKQPASRGGSAPLVPPPEVPNSRLKPSKSKKPSKVLHSRIINCLQCGRIEINAARRCAFCDSELQYEELDAELRADAAARAHMETLVAYDESGAERTTVVDTEEQLYDEVPDAAGDGGRHRRPIVLDLDLENRTFTEAVANQQLHKEARELLEALQHKMDKAAARGKRSAELSKTSAAADDATAAVVVVDDEYNALYV